MLQPTNTAIGSSTVNQLYWKFQSKF